MFTIQVICIPTGPFLLSTVSRLCHKVRNVELFDDNGLSDPCSLYGSVGSIAESFDYLTTHFNYVTYITSGGRTTVNSEVERLWNKVNPVCVKVLCWHLAIWIQKKHVKPVKLESKSHVSLIASSGRL
jgi:hypothetical protein